MVFDKGYIRGIYLLKVLMSHYNIHSTALNKNKFFFLNFDFFS
jgi:hypothetical protein